MPNKLVPYVAIIDPGNIFSRLTPQLTKRLEKDGIEVKDFSSVKNLSSAVRKFKNKIPILAIADSGAYTPSFFEGPFMMLKTHIPLAKGIAFTTDQKRKEWQNFILAGFIESEEDIIRRGNIKAVENLSDHVHKKLEASQIKEFFGKYNAFLSKYSDDIDNELINNIYNLASKGVNPSLIEQFAKQEPSTHKKRMIEIEPSVKIKVGKGMTDINRFDEETYDILVSGKFEKYIRREKLNVLQRAFFTDLVKYRLNYLSKNKGMRKRLKSFFESAKFSSYNDAWKIYKNVFLDLI